LTRQPVKFGALQRFVLGDVADVLLAELQAAAQVVVDPRVRELDRVVSLVAGLQMLNDTVPPSSSLPAS